MKYIEYILFLNNETKSIIRLRYYNNKIKIMQGLKTYEVKDIESLNNYIYKITKDIVRIEVSYPNIEDLVLDYHRATTKDIIKYLLNYFPNINVVICREDNSIIKEIKKG